MDASVDLTPFQKIWSPAREYLFQHVLSWAMAAQIVVSGCALLLAHQASGAIRTWLTRQEKQYATQARELMSAAAADTLRVLKDPKPAGLLTGFGDNGVNLELRACINDPQNGIGSVKSDLLWGIWARFREHGIEMPYPQRDVHLKLVPEITIRTGPEKV
jgi:hypothetical protein